LKAPCHTRASQMIAESNSYTLDGSEANSRHFKRFGVLVEIFREIIRASDEAARKSSIAERIAGVERMSFACILYIVRWNWVD